MVDIREIGRGNEGIVMSGQDFQAVLDFWFEGEALGQVQMERWWKKTPEVDRLIRQRFASLVDELYQGLSQRWSESPKSCLAAIICLDQFSRNMYRETRQSFQYDALALELAEQGLQKGFDRSLSPLERAFFIMPLMHDESLTSQERCISLLSELVCETEGQLERYLEGSLDFARKHHDIIARFGRYPHRNNILGRESTPEELEFLKEPGSSF